MIETFLITSRETLEASLVVGVVLAYLAKTGNKNYRKTVFYGIGAGIVMSFLIAALFSFFAGGFEGKSEALFEGITMLIGAALLTTMIFWMLKQRKIAEKLHKKVDYHIGKEHPFFSHLGIFSLIAVAILREGVETVIFLNAINFSSGLNFLGGTLGIIAAIIVGWLFFLSSKKIDLKRLFSISSVLLILFAAGLVGHGVHELEEAEVLNPIIYPLYDINPLLNEKGVFGSFMKGLFGYNGDPSLLEVLLYLSYLGLIGLMYWRIQAKPTINY